MGDGSCLTGSSSALQVTLLHQTLTCSCKCEHVVTGQRFFLLLFQAEMRIFLHTRKTWRQKFPALVGFCPFLTKVRHWIPEHLNRKTPEVELVSPEDTLEVALDFRPAASSFLLLFSAENP